MSQLKRLQIQRRRRTFRVRNKIRRVSVRPRLSVFRSNKHISAQIIDDVQGRTLAAASTSEKELRDAVSGYGGNIQAAVLVGKRIAERALEAGIRQVVFDRGSYKYHGRVAALADAARDAGLDIGPKKEPEAKPAKGDGDKQAKKSVKADKGGKGEKASAKKAK
ncbi:50S ribosomal protein L18 [Thermopirellula anaerolimosa]